MSRKLVLALFLLLFAQLQAQKDTLSLSLEKCIQIAIENNLTLRSAELRSEASEVNFKQSRSEVLPSLNASFSSGINNGRSIDPYTNSYIDEQLSYSNAGLSLGAEIFNGFRLKNSIQRDRYNMKAAEMETEEARQELVLNITLAYLQIRNAEDLVELAENRLETTHQQVDRLKILYDQGVGNPADYTDILGQIAMDRSGVVQSKKGYTDAVLNLTGLLNVENPIAIEEKELQVGIAQYELSPEEVFEDAMQGLAAFKAKELRIKAAEENVEVSRSLYSPEISVFAQLGTNYSSAARLFNESGTQVSPTGEFISLDGRELPVMFNETVFTTETIAYSDQLQNNLSSVIGVAVNIPLFNGFWARNEVALQKIALEESKVDYLDRKLQLRQNIKEAHAAMEAVYAQYLLFTQQVEAFAESYRVNEIRFNNGVSNMVAYILSKNNLDNARINLINARHEYLLRVKVLDYFRGENY